jgi:rRNA-processing protein FCF1
LPEVIFDSSFLIAVAEEPTTWFEDLTNSLGKFQPTILDCVAAELERLASRQGKRARSARVALEMAKEFQRARCGSAGVDDEIVSAALDRKAVVATTDGNLAKTLRRLHVQTVALSSRRVFLR